MTHDALRGSPLLAALPDDELQRLHSLATEVVVAPGGWLITEGSEPEAMYILLEGEFEVRRQMADEEVVVGTARAGELVGELGLLHGRPRSAGLRAIVRSRALAIPADALDDLLSHAAVSRTVLATATRRLEEQELLVAQHGRMAALGSLTAGVLHELNNPSAAVRRAASQVPGAVERMLAADRVLAAGGAELAERLAALAEGRTASRADPLARADAEERWRAWLEARGAVEAWRTAGALAAADVTVDDLAGTEGLEPAGESAAAGWLAAWLALARLLDEAGSGARRIAEIVSSIKAYSHHDEAPVQDVDVHEGIEAALTLLRHKIGPDVRVHRAYAEDLPRIEGYPGDLNVVWTNLLDNALDAVGETGEVTVATSWAPDAVTVEISDDGAGIPEGIAERIFDPFFTTKPVGKGTGLGLATSQAIVRQRHRGRITVDSAPGRTTMTVQLPCQHPTGSSSPAHQDRERAGHRQTPGRQVRDTGA